MVLPACHIIMPKRYRFITWSIVAEGPAAPTSRSLIPGSRGVRHSEMEIVSPCVTERHLTRAATHHQLGLRPRSVDKPILCSP